MRQALRWFDPPLPLNTAVLSHVALALLLWNLALRLGVLLVDGWMMIPL